MLDDARDAAAPIAGLYDSPWPAEDGGPRRQLAPRSRGLGLQPGERLGVHSRSGFMFNMVVLRAAGEVFVQGSSPPGAASTSWLERVDPVSLEPTERSVDLPGGPWWAGSVLALASGRLLVIHGRWVHQLDERCRLLRSRELPRAQPYNGAIVISDGRLVTKNLVRDGSDRSRLLLIDPDTLDLGPEVEIPEGSIARLAADRGPRGDVVYVVGDHTVFRFVVRGAVLERDRGWSHRYRTRPDAEQSFGWDPVIAGGDVWFLDNGDGEFTTSFQGGGLSAGPLHLHRISIADAGDHDELTPFGLPRGTVANPPLVDPQRRLVVCYDSGNARIAGFHYGGPGIFTRRWQHEFGAGTHFLRYPDTGEIVVNDHREDAGEHVVVLDLETGAEKGRVATGSPMQSVVFQAPGFGRDLYTCSFTTLSRVFVA